MQLVLSEDQELLAKTAADFVAEKSPVARMRALRDEDDATGFSRKLWKEMAELGWVGIPFEESVGGADLGLAELAVVMEALGRTLAPEPFLSSVLLGGQALQLAGSDAQKSAWLPAVVEGDKLVTLAHQEAHSRYELSRIQTRAERAGDAFVVTGEKVQVLDGHVADAFVVAARTAGEDDATEGITLLLVEAGAPGLEVVRQTRVDSRGAAIVKLDGVKVSADAVVGTEGKGLAILEQVVDRATVGLCAEMLGGMSEAFDLTIQYLKDRQQFDVPIGSFQALKHRAARMFIEVELARSTVMAAARAIDEGLTEAAQLVSVAKARCSDAYVLVANEGVQMFAGVGMTDEYDIGFYMKRARAAELSYGDAAWHRDRFARLSGY